MPGFASHCTALILSVLPILSKKIIGQDEQDLQDDNCLQEVTLGIFLEDSRNAFLSRGDSRTAATAAEIKQPRAIVILRWNGVALFENRYGCGSNLPHEETTAICEFKQWRP